MAEQPVEPGAVALTRTRAEWIGGSVKTGAVAAGIWGALTGLVLMAYRGVRTTFHYVDKLPDVGWSVWGCGVVAVGCLALVVYGGVMRPRRDFDIAARRGVTSTGGGRPWPGVDADVAVGGHRSGDQDVRA